MFNFYQMAGNHEERKVDNFKLGNLVIDTCYVTDGDKDYETAVSHPNYNKSKWIIVESYDTKKEAQIGHNKWKKIMTSDNLPDKLIDCLNDETSQFADLFGRNNEFNKEN